MKSHNLRSLPDRFSIPPHYVNKERQTLGVAYTSATIRNSYLDVNIRTYYGIYALTYIIQERIRRTTVFLSSDNHLGIHAEDFYHLTQSE